MSTEDNKYDSLRSRLKGLPKVKAKDNFNDKLFARIREVERSAATREQYAAKGGKLSISEWLQSLFRPAFIPAVGLTVVLLAAIIVYYGYFTGKKDTSTQQMVSSPQEEREKNGFVIYVHKDKEYPQNEIASLEPSDRLSTMTTGQTQPGMLDVSTDRVAPKTEEAPSIRMDKVSDEQKLEMQRSLEQPMKLDEKKSEDFKESKGDFERKIEKKAPSNYYRENEDTINKNKDADQQIDGSIINPQIESKTEKDKDDSLKSGKDRISKRRKKDKSHLKNNSDSLKTQEVQPPDTNQEKTEDKK